MAQVVIDQAELDRIEEIVRKYDPATHPSFAPLLDTVGEDLEVVRAYTAEIIRTHLGLGLLVRAAGEVAVKAGWSDGRGVKELINVARGDALADGPDSSAFLDVAQRRGFSPETDDIPDGAYELLRDAEAEFFSTRRLGRALIPAASAPIPR